MVRICPIHAGHLPTPPDARPLTSVNGVHNAALFMATSADTAPIIAEARGIVERIQQIDRALDLLTKAPDATESVVSTLAPQDAQGLADLPSTAAHAALRARREGTCAH